MCTSARITTFCVYFCSTSVSSLIDDMHKAKTRGALNVFRRQSLLRAAFNNHLYTTALCSEIHKYVAMCPFSCECDFYLRVIFRSVNISILVNAPH